jgi:hypothetical protein
VEDEEESTMPRRPYSTIDSLSITEVCSVSESSFSLSSHQKVDTYLGKFEKHTRGIGFKLLTKMGYDRNGLGINGQGIDNPIEVVEIPRCASLGYSKGEVQECSKVIKARNASREESKPLHKYLIQREGTSLHGSDKDCKASQMRGEHHVGVKIVSFRQTCNKNHHERYNKSNYSNVLFDYKKNGNEKHSLWYKYVLWIT